MGGEGGFGSDAVFENGECFFETFRVNRLGEVVDGVDVEGFERVVIVRGDEYGSGNVGSAELLEDVEAAGGGHFDVEEKDVYCLLFESGDDFAAVAALGDDLGFGVVGEEEAEALSGERFVVGDEDSEFHRARS
jgi:hypothetical protein